MMMTNCFCFADNDSLKQIIQSNDLGTMVVGETIDNVHSLENFNGHNQIVVDNQQQQLDHQQQTYVSSDVIQQLNVLNESNPNDGEHQPQEQIYYVMQDSNGQTQYILPSDLANLSGVNSTGDGQIHLGENIDFNAEQQQQLLQSLGDQIQLIPPQTTAGLDQTGQYLQNAEMIVTTAGLVEPSTSSIITSVTDLYDPNTYVQSTVVPATSEPAQVVDQFHSGQVSSYNTQQLQDQSTYTVFVEQPQTTDIFPNHQEKVTYSNEEVLSSHQETGSYVTEEVLTEETVIEEQPQQIDSQPIEQQNIVSSQTFVSPEQEDLAAEQVVQTLAELANGRLTEPMQVDSVHVPSVDDASGSNESKVVDSVQAEQSSNQVVSEVPYTMVEKEADKPVTTNANKPNIVWLDFSNQIKEETPKRKLLTTTIEVVKPENTNTVIAPSPMRKNIITTTKPTIYSLNTVKSNSIKTVQASPSNVVKLVQHSSQSTPKSKPISIPLVINQLNRSTNSKSYSKNNLKVLASVNPAMKVNINQKGMAEIAKQEKPVHTVKEIPVSSPIKANDSSTSDLTLLNDKPPEPQPPPNDRLVQNPDGTFRIKRKYVRKIKPASTPVATPATPTSQTQAEPAQNDETPKTTSSKAIPEQTNNIPVGERALRGRRSSLTVTPSVTPTRQTSKKVDEPTKETRAAKSLPVHVDTPRPPPRKNCSSDPQIAYDDYVLPDKTQVHIRIQPERKILEEAPFKCSECFQFFFRPSLYAIHKEEGGNCSRWLQESQVSPKRTKDEIITPKRKVGRPRKVVPVVSEEPTPPPKVRQVSVSPPKKVKIDSSNQQIDDDNLDAMMAEVLDESVDEVPAITQESVEDVLAEPQMSEEDEDIEEDEKELEEEKEVADSEQDEDSLDGYKQSSVVLHKSRYGWWPALVVKVLKNDNVLTLKYIDFPFPKPG